MFKRCKSKNIDVDNVLINLMNREFQMLNLRVKKQINDLFKEVKQSILFEINLKLAKLKGWIE
jgi:hypothetical protein